jgi:transposase
MNRAAWLRDRRMKKFRDVLSRWELGELSMMEAGELLGMSERQFRRYRGRYEEDGAEGLVDRRLGKPSPKRVPAADVQLMLELYGSVYRGWNVKHFHEHLVRDHGLRWGYTWVKTQLHTAGLVERAKRRGAHRRKRERQAVGGHDAAPGRLAGGVAGGPAAARSDCHNGRCDELLGVPGRRGRHGIDVSPRRLTRCEAWR